MKEYIDCELPKSCADCHRQHCRIGCKKNSYEPIIKKENLTSRPKECPLQSLTDYTRQVRKQVCDEIKEKAIKNYTLEHRIYTFCIEPHILDQIQGE